MSKQFFSESSHVAYQMNRKVGHATTMAIYTKDGLGEVELVSFNPVGVSIRHALVNHCSAEPGFTLS